MRSDGGWRMSDGGDRVLRSALCILHSAFLALAIVAAPSRVDGQGQSLSSLELRLTNPAGVPYAVALPSEPDAPPVPREFRGVWIATVDNIDWPSRQGLSVEAQKAELLALLDRAAATPPERRHLPGPAGGRRALHVDDRAVVRLPHRTKWARA